MPQYTNFYENLVEAQKRLLRTVVLYDGDPFYITAICNHKPDGIFRVYMVPCGRDPNVSYPYPHCIDEYMQDNPNMGAAIDAWMDATPNHGYARKMMNSPAFNKFRPFPLGMCYQPDGSVYYIQRQPTRKSEQGLTRSALEVANVALTPQLIAANYIDICSPGMANCIKGIYPSAQTCVSNLLDEDVQNTAAAFHREFAFVRGPIGVLFLAYKGDIVGFLPNGSLSLVILSKAHRHLREKVQALGLFSTVQ